MLLGDLVRTHPGSKVTAVPTGRRAGAHGTVVDHFALAEGVPDHAIAQVLLAWNLRFHEPAVVYGGPFALHLPVALDAVEPMSLEVLLRLDARLPVAGDVVQGDRFEQWIGCRSEGEAARVAGQVRQAFGPHGPEVALAEPRAEDVECWAVLREAAGLLVPLSAGNPLAAAPRLVGVDATFSGLHP
jgi:hypothetical protein